MRKTIIIDTDDNLIDILKDGYNIIETTIYDPELVERAKQLLSDINE